MSNENRSPTQKDAQERGDPVATDAKLRQARRHFLKGSAAAAGTGAIILTLHHQRASAGGGNKKIMTSSAAVCQSLRGTPGKTQQVKDIANPGGGKITAVECTIPK